MAQDRGLMIQETVSELAFRNHLRNLAKQRERQAALRAAKQKKEGCTAETEQPSNTKNSINNYTTKGAKCQDVKSNTPEHTVYGEIRKQEQHANLPVYLL